MAPLNVVVLGGSIAGSAVAIALARHGHQVTVIERDPPPAPGADPFLDWPRRGVPQFRLPHGFSARARNLLLERAPDVLERLHDFGVEEMNLFKRLVPETLWEPGDDTFANLWARRAVFEAALRLTAEAEPGVTFECPATATGLVFAPATARPEVTGVRLADGRAIEGDIVLDCGGQRGPVPRWLEEAGLGLPTDVQDCATTYYSRYYRFTPGTSLARTAVATLRGEFADGAWIGFPADDDTFAFAFECHPESRDARRLKDTRAWEATGRSIPDLAPWIDPVNSTPLTPDIQVMAGNRDVRRRFVLDGRPVVLGLLPVGDSLCSTNPAYGWGSAMALTYAFAAAEVIHDHQGDPVMTALAYEQRVGPEADALFRESAAMDRARIYRITGAEIPEDDRDEMHRQDLVAASLAQDVLRDLTLGRAFCRRVNLVGPADLVLDSGDLLKAAAQVS